VAARWSGCAVAPSLAAALSLAADSPEAFVIGGAALYAEALPHARRLYLTLIDAAYDGDTWFPEFEAAAWREISREPGIGASGLPYSFVTYERHATPD
jgi:dihydrofolate reductase